MVLDHNAYIVEWKAYTREACQSIYNMVLDVDLLDQTARSNFLRFLMLSFNCTYVCFWSYIPTPTNCLRYQDGIYSEEFNTQMASSSLGSLAQRLFDEYTQSIFAVDTENNQIPGYAFRNSFSYLEFQELDLRRLASNEIQMQFYQEARIKTAIFMGHKNIGEIELGLSNVPMINMKLEIQSLFSTQPQLSLDQLNPITTVDHHQNPNLSSSTSSPMRSLSNIDSPEYSSLLFNIPTTNSVSQAQDLLSHAQAMNTSYLQLQRPIVSTPTSASISPYQQAMQTFSRLRNPNFPSQETEQDTMAKAILAVLTSSAPLVPSSSASDSLPSSPGFAHPLIDLKSRAFKSYASVLRVSSLDNLGRKKSMFKRSVQFFRTLHHLRNRETLTIPRPSSTQLHHMMSERKRREKLNESFHQLRALLPPGTKKEKASLLNTTKEYLGSLKAQIEELSRKNKQLEAQIYPLSEAKREANKNNNDQNDNVGEANHDRSPSSSSDQRVIDVRLSHLSDSASNDEAEIIELQVIVIRATIQAEDLLLRLLEFLKRVDNMSLISMEANTNDSINRIILRLRISKGSEWDESAFQEAVRRVVADLAQ